MVSVPARSQVAYATGRGLSQRRACTLMGVARSALAYRPVKAARDAPVVARMAELSAQYPRHGYRRIAIFLARDGHGMSFGRAHRLWRQARLQVPRKRPRKRIATGRPRPNAPAGANQVWCYDFLFDWCANGQRLKYLTVTDEWTKEDLAIEVSRRIRSARVKQALGEWHRGKLQRQVPRRVFADLWRKRTRKWSIRLIHCGPNSRHGRTVDHQSVTRIAPRRSTKASMREAKIVPLVRLNWSLHLYFRRVERT